MLFVMHLLNECKENVKTKNIVRNGWLIFATKRTKRSQSCKSPIEDAEAPVPLTFLALLNLLKGKSRP
jgi:hypothetical protein